MQRVILFLICVSFYGLSARANEKKNFSKESGTLPSGFVYLTDIAPTILEDLRYATTQNFTGSIVPGYESGKCILAQPVAKALARVQQRVLKKGFSLKTYDCYRPARAVKYFVRWAQSKKASSKVTEFYHPRITRAQTLAKGYIASQSSHSRGVSVDLTIVKLAASDGARSDARLGSYGPCNGPAFRRVPDNGLEMGTSWDCFDPDSHTASAAVSKTARRNRLFLRQIMQTEGFENFSKEWWHYRYPTSGFITLHDFPITTKRGGTRNRKR